MTRELHTRLLRPRLNFSSQLSEARRAMKKMAASPMIAMTLTASAISSTASTIESTITRADSTGRQHCSEWNSTEGRCGQVAKGANDERCSVRNSDRRHAAHLPRPKGLPARPWPGGHHALFVRRKGAGPGTAVAAGVHHTPRTVNFCEAGNGAADDKQARRHETGTHHS